MIYGYGRISQTTQKIERQITNILKRYPTAKIYQEAYTGRKFNGRKEFAKLLKVIKPGDIIVFDSVSRMSRTKEEGVETYFELFDRGIKLIFLNEPYINTDVYADNLKDKIPLQGTDEDEIFKGLNNYFRKLAKKQIEIAFEQAEKEVADLRQRTSEGLREAKMRGKQIGQVKGTKFTVKKAVSSKETIKKHSKTFGGSLTDKELIKMLGIARNTYYKYKADLIAEYNTESEEEI